MAEGPEKNRTDEEPEVVSKEEGIARRISKVEEGAGRTDETDAPEGPKTPEGETAKRKTASEPTPPDETSGVEWPETPETAAGKAKAGHKRPSMTPVNVETDISAEKFAEMAELYEESFRELEEESVVKGKIVAITGDDVLIDIGYKSEGSIPASEFENIPDLKPGDEVDVYLDKKEDQDGLIVLSKEKADFFRAWDRVRRAYEENGEIDGVIQARVRGGFTVGIGVKAFLPSSQLDVRPVSDFDAYIGKTFTFKVIKVNKKRRNIVISRKALLEEARAEKKADLLATIKKGLILEGEVKNITDFGAFIDLGGLDGLLHITDLSWGRVNHPSDVLSVGDKVEVMVLDFDREKERVSLGLKQLKPHPWENVKVRYNKGDRVVGNVVSITDYGAFVELEEGVEGLIHISEMSWTHRIKHPSKILSVGDEVESVILNIDEENQRISLGLRQTMENPWEGIAERLPAGTVFEGLVRNITDFGAFVELEEGIDGLVRVSDMSWTKKVRHPSELLKKGDTVKVVVLNVDTVNQRISLGMKQLEPNPWDVIEQTYPVGTYVEGEVVRITNYGGIIRFDDEIEGLLHLTELPGEDVSKVTNVVNIGDRVKVKVINVSASYHKINLSLKQYVQETGEDGIIERKPPTEPETRPDAEAAVQEEPSAEEPGRDEDLAPEEPPAEPEPPEKTAEDEEATAQTDTPEEPPEEHKTKKRKRKAETKTAAEPETRDAETETSEDENAAD